MNTAMKKTLKTALASAILSISIIPTTAISSHAKSVEPTRINGEGFRKCKAQGDSGYTAIIRGRSLYTAPRNGDFGLFNVRSCFQTKAQCVNFVRNVPRHIRGVYDIQYSSCKARG